MSQSIGQLRAQQASLSALITGQCPDPETAGILLRATPQGGTPRLDIYRHAYRARLTAAMRENYPILFRVLGDEDFDRLALQFIAHSPSHRPSIRWYGEDLAAFVEAAPERVPHPSLGDLIRMEWALCCAFDAADAEPLDAERLSTVPPEDWPGLSFHPHPTLHLLDLAWAVEPLWSALNADADAPTVPPEPQRHHLLVWRGEEQTHWRSLDTREAQLLAACCAGTPFAALCEEAAAKSGDAAAGEVAGYLRRWIDAGLFLAPMFGTVA